MKKSFVKSSLVALPALFAASAASAQSYSWWYSYWGWNNHGSGGGSSSQVPEIDASTGVLAVAALGAGMLLAREVKRRRKG